jgi:exodeoxyribonuclease V gamma subunit
LEEGERLAPFLELLQSLATWQQRLQRPLPPAQWRHQLENLLAAFFLPVDASDEAALVAAREALQTWMEECEAAQLTTPLSIEIVAPAWQDKMQGALAQAGGFFSGGLTFATLMPMRAIPFRQIYLLGMNEKDYPRRQIQPEFDLLRGDYRPGDRSRREDDRYLFLEALLSARERLHIYWSGRNPRTDAEEPPSVLVAQLRDHLARIWSADTSHGTLRGADFLRALTQEHPLQPFSGRYLAGEDRSYAREWWQPSNPFPAASAIIPEPLHNWRLSDLQALGKNPARYFLRQGLGLYPALAGEDLAEDLEPFALDGLQQWQLRQELIETAQRSPIDPERVWAQIEECSRRQQRRGDLPAAALGSLLAEGLRRNLQVSFERYIALCSRFAEALPPQWLTLSLAGRAVEGEISGLRQDTSGSLILPRWSASHLEKDKSQRLDKIWPYWIEHLALHAAGLVLHSHLLDQTNHFCLAPLAQDQAERQLQQIISAAEQGRLQPLPFLLPLPGKVFNPAGRVDASLLRAAYPALAQQDWYLRRVWPDADALLAVGVDAMEECYQTLAMPLVECLAQGKEALG